MKTSFAVVAAVVALAAAAPGAFSTPSGSSTPFITDTLAPGGGTSAGHVDGYRFITDTLAPGGGQPAVVAPAAGFRWADAGVGAGAATGHLVALVGGILLVTRRSVRIAI